MAIKLIVGLRNPGPNYASTRHNAGAWQLETIADHTDVSFSHEKKLHAEIAYHLGSVLQSCRLLLPTTFMNESGLPVREAAQFFRIQPEEILVIHDELDLPAGRIKLKTGGGHGGHNGLRDIISHLNSNNFHRLRIGIGHPGHKDLVLNYVLGQPSKSDKQSIMEATSRVLPALPWLIEGKIIQAMNEING